ncbi:MAG: hypothetical protein NXI16_16975 [Alphaproteobacteria bacterium]|nr:hypothetical protein [Alphaproteobacteria bacterium]
MDRLDRRLSSRRAVRVPVSPRLGAYGAAHRAAQIIVVAGTALFVAGCQLPAALAPVPDSKATISQEEAQKERETAPKPAFSEFTDVPIPSESEMDLEETIILGAEEGWIGRLSMNSTHSMGDMYSFYDTEMPKFGWTRLTVVRSEISTLTFQRAGRIATITLQPRGFSRTAIDFTVSPERKQTRS